ncbi:MAG: hypothetical protein ACOYWZ_14210 [Bacillota bacterium]
MDLMKYIKAIGFIGIISLALFVSACDSEKVYSQEQFDEAVDSAKSEGLIEGYENGYREGESSVEVVDVTSNDQQVIDEYIASLPAIEETTEAEAVIPLALHTEDCYLGEDISSVLDENEISKLAEIEIKFDGNEYDTKEQLILSTDLVCAYSGDSSYDDEFYGNPYLAGLARETIKYTYSFEDAVEMADIEQDEQLQITFLGSQISIVDVQSGEMTYFTTPRSYLMAGESITVGEKTLTLISVGSSQVVVAVDGVTEIIEAGNTEEVNEIDVFVEAAFDRDELSESSASIIAGSGAQETVKNGEYYDEDEKWIWQIEDDGTNLLSISIVLDEKFNRVDSDISALEVEKCIALPEEYVKVCFDKTNQPNTEKAEIYFDTIDISGVDHDVVVFDMDDDFLVVDSENVDTLFFDGTDLYYKDEADYILVSTDSAVVEVGDALYDVEFYADYIELTDSDGNFIVIAADAVQQRLGLVDEEAETDDIVYNADSVGTRDGDLLTAYGIKILEVKENAENDEAVLELVDDKLEMTIGFY